MASAWLGGLGPGLFATVLGLLAIVAANDAPGDLASLVNRLVRFGSLALLITFLFTATARSRRRAEIKEQEFRRSEGRYRRLVETAGEGIWAFDPRRADDLCQPPLGRDARDAARAAHRPRHSSEFLADDAATPETLVGAPDRAPFAWHEIRLRGATARSGTPSSPRGRSGRTRSPATARLDPGRHPAGSCSMVTDVTAAQGTPRRHSARKSRCSAASTSRR